MCEWQRAHEALDDGRGKLSGDVYTAGARLVVFGAVYPVCTFDSKPV